MSKRRSALLNAWGWALIYGELPVGIEREEPENDQEEGPGQDGQGVQGVPEAAEGD